MTGRRPSALDAHFEAWARWSANGRQTAPKSMLAKAIDNHGLLHFGAGSSGPVDDIESAIEAAVLRLSQDNLLAADVLRIEYCAGVWGVCQRRRMVAPLASAIQREKAQAMGLGHATYRRRLKQARDYIQAALQR